MYERFEVPEGSKLYLVGDLHGEISKLREKLEAVGFDYDTDFVVCTGDLIDRGEDSLACLRLLDEPWFKTVRGNHEEMAYQAVSHRAFIQLWFQNGGTWYTKLTPEEIIEADKYICNFDKLPLIMEIKLGVKTIVVAHADYPDLYEFGKEVHQETLLWARNRLKAIMRGDIVPAIEGADAFFFGHTPVNQIIKNYNQFYIDTGACYDGGDLTIVEFKDYEEEEPKEINECLK